MATGVLGGGFTFDICSVGGTWSWRVTASNVHGAGQLYQVEDIKTPFGSLANTDIPLPGEVVTAMASSLETFKEQLQPRIVLTGPASFNLTVTEGDGVYAAGEAAFTNAGAFGSFMTATGVPDSPWLAVTPPVVAGINKNGSGQMSVRVDPRIMLATSSPYFGHVNIQDNAGHVVPVEVSVTVLPRPAILLSQDAVAMAFYLSSNVPAGPASITVGNSGPPGSFLSFSLAKVQNQSPWLAINPMSGTNMPSGSEATVTFTLISANVPTVPGVYTEIIRVASPNASNSPRELTVSMTVIP